MNGLKLFVLGESSPDPEEWSGCGTMAIVIAASKDEALSMVDFTSTATEIAMDKTAILCIKDVDPDDF
jgi:hypothetical protein